MGTTNARGCLVMRSMKQILLTALFALLLLTPARAQLQFSDSLRISLLTCTAGPDAYERFGHAGVRIKDLKQESLDVTFHYGVFSFNAPHFVYRFVKGETDYMLGALPTLYFVEEYRERGLGMTEQTLRLDSAQAQQLAERLLINYRPENRTYRYSYFFDNCSTRPYHLLNAATNNVISYDSAWVNAISLRQMVQECTGLGNWLNFGIALAVAGRADRQTTYEEQLFLPGYLSKAVDHATIPINVGDETVQLPLVTDSQTLLTMRDDVAQAIAAPDPVAPRTVLGVLLMIGAVLMAMVSWKRRANARSAGRWEIALRSYDTLWLTAVALTGCIVWFLNFFSLHPAVDHNLNCLWLLPTHLIAAGLIWVKRCQKVCSYYFGITFALVIVYVVADWITGQYCPPEFLLLLATILLRSFGLMQPLTKRPNDKNNIN